MSVAWLSRWTSFPLAISRSRNGWTLAHPGIAAAREAAAAVRTGSDGQFLTAADELRRQTLRRGGHPGGDYAPAAIGLMAEAIRRTLGMELYDSQLLAGLAMTEGAVAELGTGEGKTLSAALPSFVFSLAGRGVHVMTANQYLSARDAEQLRPAFALLGCSLGMLKTEDGDQQRRHAYRCHVTYGAGYEFGFDFLKDRLLLLKRSRPKLGELVPTAQDDNLRQRVAAYAVVDEADSVLLDEAGVPMIIGGATGPQNGHGEAAACLAAQNLAERSRRGVDFELEGSHGVRLLPPGTELARRALEAAGDLHVQRPWPHYVQQAIAANVRLQRDVDYVVVENRVQIVDVPTGRIHKDRSWQDGLHQAVEAKERLPFTPASKTLAQITRQRYAKRYDKLCGMTGTTSGAETEFREAYGLEVVRIAPHRPSQRQAWPDRFFRDAASKTHAAAAEIAAVSRSGRPVLVGSGSIRDSEAVAAILRERGVECQVLNGLQTADEAALVAQAGRPGAVTVATNMAGRGTDIRLGPGVAALGGLHLASLERHPSQRTDGQLIGRVGRQGDPGSYRFFVSAEDPLLLKNAPRLADRFASLPHRDGEIEHDLSRDVLAVQRRLERDACQRRLQLRERDAWLDETIARLYGA